MNFQKKINNFSVDIENLESLDPKWVIETAYLKIEWKFALREGKDSSPKPSILSQ